MDNTQILYLAGAFLLGFLIAWFAGRGGPTRAAEEAAAETDTVRRKLSTTESDLRKTQGQLKENLATLDQSAADKENLIKMLRASEQGLNDAGVELNRLTSALNESRDERLLLETELGQARGALTDARSQIAGLTAKLDTVTEIAVEAAGVAEEVAETAALAKNDETARMIELESQLALARATAERLAEKEILVSAELFLRRREYRDIVTGGEDAMVAALAARDQALANAQTQLDYMRRDLSMLTSAGAQLAITLEQRNGEYGSLLNRFAASEIAVRALPEVSLAGKAAAIAALPGKETAAATEVGPDLRAELQAELEARAAELDELKNQYETLKADLERAIATRDELQSQFDARLGEIEELNGKVEAGAIALDALTAEKAGLLRKVAERADIINHVLSQIGEFDEQLRAIASAAFQPANHDASSAATEAVVTTTQQGEGETHAG